MTETPSIAINETLLRGTVRLNTLLTAGISGLMAGLGLLCLTWFSQSRGLTDPTQLLSLVGMLLPGYSVSAAGAWVGFLWGGVLGAIAGAVIYRIYAHSIRQRVADYSAGDTSAELREYIVLKISGHALGIALGGTVAFALLATTNWLAFHGIEIEKIRAGLLAHYLPGYSVSFPGSIAGAVEIFIIVYLFCLLLGTIYNRVNTVRQKAAAS